MDKASRAFAGNRWSLTDRLAWEVSLNDFFLEIISFCSHNFAFFTER